MILCIYRDRYGRLGQQTQTKSTENEDGAVARRECELTPALFVLALACMQLGMLDISTARYKLFRRSKTYSTESSQS
jgi:hypothetical protein